LSISVQRIPARVVSEIETWAIGRISNCYISRTEKIIFDSGLPGKIIALEGIDQSGKRTQAQLLARHLRRIGSKAVIISFPMYGSPAGRQVSRYLTGKRRYPVEALHMLYSLNRWENKDQINRLMKNADFVIADRYTPSNLAYGVSRGLSLEWLQGLDEGLPRTSLVIVFDVPIRASFARKSKNRDIHESDHTFLTTVRRTYRGLAYKLGWKVVDGRSPIGKVHAAVWDTVQQRFGLARELAQ
jgi:dTMP kinase